jgi:hypothetical protein
MNIAEAKRQARLSQWAEMVNAQQSSGKGVRQWCESAGISNKCYYYRLRQVRLAALENSITVCPSNIAILKQPPTFTKLVTYADKGNEIPNDQNQAKSMCPLTVHIGRVVIDISNNADHDMVTHILRVVGDI